MTLKEARAMVKREPQFWDYFRYTGAQRRLKWSKAKYETAAARFLLYTFDAYVLGSGDYSRGQAWEQFEIWAYKHHDASMHEATMISHAVFKSIDSVHAYT